MKYSVTFVIAIAPSKSIELALNSIKNLNYPKNKIDILIVEGKQPSKQRNLAIKNAKGDIIYFIDDDVVLEKESLNYIVKHYDDERVAVVGGPNLTPETDTPLQKNFGYAMGSFFGAAGMSARYKIIKGSAREASEKELILCNLSARASIIKNNLFVEHLYPNEENELFNRLRRNGYRLIVEPLAIAYHSRRPTIWKFIKQNFHYGRGRMEHMMVKSAHFSFLFFIPTLFTAYLFLLIFFNNIYYFIPLFLYIITDLITVAKLAIANKKALSIFILLFIFPMIHVPYGIGIVYGFFRNFFKKEKEVEIKLTEIKV